ncbi:MAG: response regulator [Acidobacteriota bacterium]
MGHIRDESKKLILLIDDDPVTIQALNYRLVNSDYEVVLAKNGQDGIMKAVSLRPDLIFMDMMMPGLNGFEATKQLRAIDDFDHVPIVAVTSVDNREKTINAGCDDYIHKPLTEVRDIVARIDRWITARQ